MWPLLTGSSCRKPVEIQCVNTSDFVNHTFYCIFKIAKNADPDAAHFVFVSPKMIQKISKETVRIFDDNFYSHVVN